ncbi:hypothetical protein B0I35DRAFT_415117 [Stachybotrys elegans]|uniref:Uncharacterized protein n=1 Tax=Stachybotrys elegans TaxID=80388 RepID=A0A8K0SDG2_9HYPO|nr:hypothetical protein B0I35DRAFT_415117 [Stachybotrys elegans]
MSRQRNRVPSILTPGGPGRGHRAALPNGVLPPFYGHFKDTFWRLIPSKMIQNGLKRTPREPHLPASWTMTENIAEGKAIMTQRKRRIQVGFSGFLTRSRLLTHGERAALLQLGRDVSDVEFGEAKVTRRETGEALTPHRCQDHRNYLGMAAAWTSKERTRAVGRTPASEFGYPGSDLPKR